MTNENELHESDYLAGSVIRQMLFNIRHEGERAYKKKHNDDYCDVALIIYPNSNNGKGGLWFYMWKDYFSNEKPGIAQDVNGYNYDFIDIKSCIRIAKEDIKEVFLSSMLEQIANGSRNYDFVTCSMSYNSNEELHDENRKAIKEYIYSEPDWEGIREIIKK